MKWLNSALAGPRSLPASFLAAIFLGALFLVLPYSTTSGGISFVDALFTSTSAVCVTGLTVVDTGKDFTLFGQLTILLLMQAGGLGIMTYSLLVVAYMGGGPSYRFKLSVKEAMGRFSLTNLSAAIWRIILAAFAVEAIGTAALLCRFAGEYPFSKALYYSVFHAVSAFCNAGFSLFPDSLMRYQSDLFMNLAFALLIIVGGIGFVVIFDLLDWPKERRLSLHSKVALTVSGALILLGTVGIFSFEWLHNLQFHEGRSGPTILMTAFSSPFRRGQRDSTRSTSGACPPPACF